MKRILCSTLLLFLCSTIFGQICIPESNLPTDFLGVFPKPFVEEDPESGIKTEACIGSEYNLTLTVFVPDEYDLGFGIPLVIQSITLVEVQGLPEGLAVECNRPGCLYPSEEIDCLVLKGTPNAANTPGNYDLLIKMTANTNLSPNLPLEFPGILAMGKYTIKLNPESSEICNPTSLSTHQTPQKLTIFPNPAQNLLTIDIDFSKIPSNKSNGRILISDLTGVERIVKYFDNIADVQKELDIHSLANGIHLLQIINSEGTVLFRNKFIKI